MTEFPRSSEKPSSTHGRYGAWKVKRPKKFMRTYGLRRLQTYTSMMVNAWPRNTRLTNTAMSCCRQSMKIPNSDPFTSLATNRKKAGNTWLYLIFENTEAHSSVVLVGSYAHSTHDRVIDKPTIRREFAKSSFRYYALSLRHLLPTQTVSSNSLSTFKSRLKSHFSFQHSISTR